METLKLFLFIDERTGKFSTSKLMVLMSFYLIVFLNIRALYLDREVKNASFLQETLMITSSLYFGRKFSLKSKNIETGGEQSENK